MTEQSDDAPNLSDVVSANYLLAHVTVRTYGGERTDRDIADEIHRTKGAASSTGTYIRKLFGTNCTQLAEVKSAYNKLRHFLYDRSLPWVSDSSGLATGARLVPVADSMQLITDFVRRKDEAQKLRDAMADDLDNIIASARASMGSMAPDISEYPTASEFKRKFDATLDVTPVPAVTDFSRLSVPGKLAQGLQGVYESRMKRQVDNALNDAKERTAERLKVYAVQLGKNAAGEKTRLYQSMHDNLSKEVSLLGAISATCDPQMEVVARDIYDTILRGYPEVKVFKDNTSLCRDKSNAARKLLRQLNGEDLPEVEESTPAAPEQDELDASLEEALADLYGEAEAPKEVEEVKAEEPAEEDNGKPFSNTVVEDINPDDFVL